MARCESASSKSYSRIFTYVALSANCDSLITTSPIRGRSTSLLAPSSEYESKISSLVSHAFAVSSRDGGLVFTERLHAKAPCQLSVPESMTSLRAPPNTNCQ